MVGKTISHYRILERLGGAGMASICLLVLSLLVYPPPAVAQFLTRSGLDCTELSQLEPLPEHRQPRRSHYLGVEELFHELLLGWPGNGAAETAAELSDLEQRLSERLECIGEVEVEFPRQLPRPGSDRPGALFMVSTAVHTGAIPPFVCLAVIEGRTLEPIFDSRPRTLLATARLYQQKHGFQLLQRRPWYARRSLDQVEALLAYHSLLADGEANATAAMILTLAAVDLAELHAVATTEEAASVLHRALELDPGHELALYLAAHLEEKLADYRHAREHLELLVERRPGDAELRLRLAINLARTGEKNDARKLLAELLAASPDWVAIVAAQELATLLAEDRQEAEAALLLQGALERFPGSSQLRLQLAQIKHADWRSSWPLVDRVLNGWTADRGEPARMEYERSRPEWIRDRAAALDEELREAQRSIVEAVAELGERSERRRMLDSYRLESLCRGTLPLRRLPTDQDAGPFTASSPGDRR